MVFFEEVRLFLEHRRVEALPIQGNNLAQRKILCKPFFCLLLLILPCTYLSLDVTWEPLLLSLRIPEGHPELFNLFVKWLAARGLLILQLCLEA